MWSPNSEQARRKTISTDGLTTQMKVLIKLTFLVMGIS